MRRDLCFRTAPKTLPASALVSQDARQVEVLNRHIPRHWKQRGLSWGWTAVIWLAYILTEGDHYPDLLRTCSSTASRATSRSHLGAGQDYQDLFGETELLALGNIQVRVQGLESLIQVKQQVNREKDRAALPILQHTLEEKRKTQEK
jgi:hypothetical protein